MKATQANTLKNVLNLFNNLHNGITAGNIIAFLEIASNEGITSNTIAFRLGVSKKTISKQLSVLKGCSSSTIHETPLVKEVQDENDKRYKNLYLTEKGKELVMAIELMIQQQNKLDAIDIRTLFKEENNDANKNDKERVEN